MANYTVFYGNQLYGEFNEWKEFRLAIVGEEIYNGSYYFNKQNREWYRLDGTPVLITDVPKITRTLALLLSL